MVDEVVTEESPKGNQQQNGGGGVKTADQLLKEVSNEIAKQKAGPFKAEIGKLLKEEEDLQKSLKLVRIKIAKAVEDYNAGIL